jgi:hypothetical protein
MNAEQLLNKIVKPGWGPDGHIEMRLIDELDEDQKLIFENKLIELLIQNNKDDLIKVIFGYLKSNKALPLLKSILLECIYERDKILTASIIFEISKEQDMIQIALEAAKKITKKSEIIDMFYDLIKFNNKEINEFIQTFYTNPEFLVSYNAKQALDYQKKLLDNQSQQNN